MTLGGCFMQARATRSGVERGTFKNLTLCGVCARVCVCCGLVLLGSFRGLGSGFVRFRDAESSESAMFRH